MRALVTGLNGFVGGHLADHLLSLGDVVTGLSNTQTWPPGRESLAELVSLERFDLTSASLDQLTQLITRIEPQAIYHLAAQSNPQASVADPRGTWTANLTGTLNLLEAVRASGAKPSHRPGQLRRLLRQSRRPSTCPSPKLAPNAPITRTPPARPPSTCSASSTA